MRRYFSIYAALWRNALVRELQFKVNFLLWIVVELAWFALQLAFMAVIYAHTDRIASWTKWEVVLLVGANHFMQQVFTAMFLNNCMQLSERVRAGTMDFLLLLPVNTRFLVSLRHVDFGAFVNAASAAAVMVYALRQLGLVPSAPQLLGFVLLCAAGVMVHYSIMFILACASFWIVRAQGLVWGYYNLFQIARLPDDAFRGGFRLVFTFVIPVLLVSNVPARLLAEKLASPWPMLGLVAASAACFAVSEGCWRLSVRRYTSASS